MVEGAASSEAASRREPRRVLIVDDDNAVRQLLRTLVEGLPIPTQVYEATAGDIAIDLGRRSRPDLALVDIVLPESGPSACWCAAPCAGTRAPRWWW